MLRFISLRAGLALGVSCLALSPVAAQDSDEAGVRLYFDLEQEFEAGDNVDLDVPSEGSSTSSATRLTFGLSSITPIAQLDLSASAALVIENTPDTDGTETDLGRPEFVLDYVREVPEARFALSARFRTDDVDAFEDEDLDVDDDEGTRTDYGLGFAFDFMRTAPLSFGIEAAYDRTEYEDTIDPDLNDTETQFVGLEARLRFSEVLTGIGNLSFESEDEEDDAETLTETVIASFGVEYLASSRLGVTAALGWTEIDTTEFGIVDRTSGPVAQFGLDYAMTNGNATADIILTTDEDEGERVRFLVGRSLELPDGALDAQIGVTSAEDAGTDLIGALDWTRTLPNGEVGINLAREVSYDDDDDETEVETSLAIDWTREINALSSISLDLSYEVSDAPSERIEEGEIGATYSYALTADWALNSGVSYSVRDDEDGWAESPLVFLTIGRRFDFRP
jgi:hypothetical protein